MDRPTLALTLGDPAGIGPEIMAKALADGEAYDHLVPVVVGDRKVLEQVIEGCDLELETRAIEAPDDARGERGTVDLIDLGVASAETHGQPGVTEITGDLPMLGISDN